MFDRIKFMCQGIYLDPTDPTGIFINSNKTAKLKNIVKKLQFSTGIGCHENNEYKRPIWKIRFKFRNTRIADVSIIETETGNLTLYKVDANIPSLLRGHNGTLPQNNWEVHLALTRLDRLLAPLFETDSHKKFLRTDRHGSCAWHICMLEASAQFTDPNRQAILDSHLSQLKGFVKKPFIVPGETTTLNSEELKFTVYAKDLKIAKSFPWNKYLETTRVEARFFSSRAIVKALKLHVGGARIHTIPFEYSSKILTNIANDRLVGGIATANNVRPSVSRGSTNRIINKSWSPANMHSALHMECKQVNGSNASKLRKRVFDSFACECPTDLSNILEQINGSIPMVGMPIGYIEEAYNEACAELGMPMEPDPEIVATFSELRTS